MRPPRRELDGVDAAERVAEDDRGSQSELFDHRRGVRHVTGARVVGRPIAEPVPALVDRDDAAGAGEGGRKRIERRAAAEGPVQRQQVRPDAAVIAICDAPRTDLQERGRLLRGLWWLNSWCSSGVCCQPTYHSEQLSSRRLHVRTLDAFCGACFDTFGKDCMLHTTIVALISCHYGRHQHWG